MAKECVRLYVATGSKDITFEVAFYDTCIVRAEISASEASALAHLLLQAAEGLRRGEHGQLSASVNAEATISRAFFEDQE